MKALDGYKFYLSLISEILKAEKTDVTQLMGLTLFDCTFVVNVPEGIVTLITDTETAGRVVVDHSCSARVDKLTRKVEDTLDDNNLLGKSYSLSFLTDPTDMFKLQLTVLEEGV